MRNMLANFDKFKVIGKWQDLATYYVDPATGTVWAYGCGGSFSNCGQEDEFRANFSKRYRGELYATR